MIIDTHAHLTFADFDQDIEEVISRAHEQDVQIINTIGITLKEMPKQLALCETYDNLYTTVGVHPHGADKEQVTVEDILHHCGHAKVVGIGESGLDFHYNSSSREGQIASFRTHVQAAVAAGLPLVVHTREAEAETREVLESEGISECGGILHCFTGSYDMARWALDQGMQISFSGIITFKNAQDLRDIAARLPLERLLVETDSPYLAPMPHRGKRNEPSYVRRVVEVLAELHGRTVDEVGEITSRNAMNLFRFGLGSGQKKEILAYTIRDSLYLNITRGCTLRCGFCPKWTSPSVAGYDLSLKHNPTARELIDAMGDISDYREVVFCGYGEPTLRLKVLLEVAREVKSRGGKVRLNTDGLANRVYRRDVTPELNGLIDAISISLNAQNREIYDRHCKPSLKGSYDDMLAFVGDVKAHVPDVTVTAIDGLEGVDIAACRAIAENLGVQFRARNLNIVG